MGDIIVKAMRVGKGWRMQRTLIALVFLAFSQTSQAQSTLPAASGDVPATAAATRSYTLDTPIGTIAADPGGAMVINKDIPGLLSDPNYSIIKGMSLHLVASLSGGDITKQMLDQTESDLKALPVVAHQDNNSPRSIK